MRSWARRLKLGTVAVALALLFVPNAAHAAMKFLTPLLDKGDGSVECTNCCTGSSLSTGNVIVGGGSSAISALANNGTATIMYLQNSSGINSGNPGWRAPLLTDYGTGTVSAANLSTILANGDETGTAGKLVWDTGPTISAPTITGAASFTGVTGSVSWAGTTAPMTFPADTFADFTDFAGSIKTGGTNGTKLVTAGTFTPGSNNCAKWNSNGTLEDSGGPCGGSSMAVSLDVSPMTQIVASTTPIYCGMDGSCSATENDVVTPFHHSTSATYTDMLAMATTGTTQAITVVMGVGTCGSALNYTTKAQYAMSATAFTTGTPGGTTTVANGECTAFRLTTGSGTSTKAILRISVKQTAGT